MKTSNRIQRFALVCAASLLFNGCFLKPVTVRTRQFVLVPIPAAEPPAAATAPLSVGVGFVKMPEYLLKDEVAICKGANEIEYLEDTLWAERLDRGFQRTLAADLSKLLPSAQMYLTAWGRDQVAVALFVSVERFDVDLKGQGTLVASWRLGAPGNDKPLKSGQVRLAHPGASPRGNPQVIVTTMSALTGELSRDLAREIRSSLQPPIQNSSEQHHP
jgi:uncharacterized lipoprotein YmbA